MGKTLDVNLSPKHNYKGNSSLATENQELTKEISDILNSMGSIKIKTKSIISESLKPIDVAEKQESNLLDESNLLEEM